ncbi:Rrf2 family transcriptional regulator [Acuticoccus sp. M5D2P5]|uniref:Rrf2 family transcriptional regulator n=1 Tax=Acuticoccus kalidii TaxID=2910977 RepID=UPI001F3E2F8E|nr:Rrf2 family transcriptional regulator [Acuticoccus kalidii]MCF3933326.1 Rrf2 family transcriptional regulator [Acuticoccus kalidii]
MRLTSFTDYGLRMLIAWRATPIGPSRRPSWLRNSASPATIRGRSCSASRGGLIETRRDGASLAIAAEEIRLGTIVRFLEEGQPLVECFAAGGSDCTIGGHCRLKLRLRWAEAAFIADLDRSTLADIALARPLPA